MPTLQIRKLPQEIYDNLAEIAKNSRRSLTQQAIIFLEEAIQEYQREKIRTKSKVLNKIKKRGQTVDLDSKKGLEWLRDDRER